MEITNNLPVLWDVFDRFFIPYVLFGTILSNVGRGGLSWTDCTLCYDDYVWSDFYDGLGSIYQCPFPRKFINIHDGVCLGETE